MAKRVPLAVKAVFVELLFCVEILFTLTGDQHRLQRPYPFVRVCWLFVRHLGQTSQPVCGSCKVLVDQKAEITGHRLYTPVSFNLNCRLSCYSLVYLCCIYFFFCKHRGETSSFTFLFYSLSFLFVLLKKQGPDFSLDESSTDVPPTEGNVDACVTDSLFRLERPEDAVVS